MREENEPGNTSKMEHKRRTAYVLQRLWLLLSMGTRANKETAKLTSKNQCKRSIFTLVTLGYV